MFHCFFFLTLVSVSMCVSFLIIAIGRSSSHKIVYTIYSVIRTILPKGQKYVKESWNLKLNILFKNVFPSDAKLLTLTSWRRELVNVWKSGLFIVVKKNRSIRKNEPLDSPPDIRLSQFCTQSYLWYQLCYAFKVRLNPCLVIL